MFIQIVFFSYYYVGDKGKKRNLRRTSKNFTFVGENLMYKGTRLVIKSSQEKQQIIKDIHEGIGDHSKAKAMASHRGRDTTYQKISERFFWHDIFDDVSAFVKHCESCQKQGKMEKSISPELQSVPVPPEVMKQIGIDLCNLPIVDEFKHLVVCIDYFSKWSEAKAVKDKLATTVATFIYEVICCCY